MKRSLLTVFAAALVIAAHSQGLEGIIVEKFYLSDPADSINADENFATYPLSAGSTTYRVYADLLPGYKVIQVFGSQAHTLNIETTTSFYNDPNYGFSTYAGTSVVNTKKNTTLIDSYLTIGGVATGLVGVLKEEDTDGTIGNIQGVLANDDTWAGTPIMGTDGQDGLMPGTPVMPNILGLTTELDVFDQTPGSSFLTSGGTIAALGGVAGVTESNHVLLGQFTTDGILSFKLNLQIATPIEGESEIYVAEAPEGVELTDATLTYVSEEVPDFIREANSHNTNNFFLYPNPCGAFVNILQSAVEMDKVDVKILDVTGRVILSSLFTGTSYQLNTSDLSSGIYTMRLERRGRMETVKFVKQ